MSEEIAFIGVIQDVRKDWNSIARQSRDQENPYYESLPHFKTSKEAEMYHRGTTHGLRLSFNSDLEEGIIGAHMSDEKANGLKPGDVVYGTFTIPEKLPALAVVASIERS